MYSTYSFIPPWYKKISSLKEPSDNWFLSSLKTIFTPPLRYASSLNLDESKAYSNSIPPEKISLSGLKQIVVPFLDDLPVCFSVRNSPFDTPFSNLWLNYLLSL